MVKHTQTIRQQLPTNCLSVFDHFVILVLKGLIQIFEYDIRDFFGNGPDFNEKHGISKICTHLSPSKLSL